MHIHTVLKTLLMDPLYFISVIESKPCPDEDKTKPNVLRKLGYNETYQLAMYTLDQYSGTSIACRYTIPSRFGNPESRPNLVRVIESGVANTVLKHPVLQVGIADAESVKPGFVQLQRLDLREHMTWCFLDSSQDFDKASQELTAAEVDGKFLELGTRPGWRVVVMVQESASILEIGFTWNHAHCDGVSGRIFQEDLFQSLNARIQHGSNPTTRPESFIIELPQALQLPPPIETVCKLPLSLGYTAKMVWEEFGLTSLAWTRPSLARWCPIQLSPYKTQFRAFDVTNLNSILLSCRQHKTTLTGLLHGLTMVSLASQIDQEAAPAFEGCTTMDMRRFLPSNPPAYPGFQPHRTMGNYVTMMSHVFDSALISQIRSKLPNDEGKMSADLLQQIWPVATRIRGEIERRLETGLTNDLVGFMKYVSDWRHQMNVMATRSRQFSWMITGLGVLKATSKIANAPLSISDDAAGEEIWTIQRAQFALSVDTTSAAFVISPISVAGGQLTVGVSWQDCICDVSMGERITNDLQRWLCQVAMQSQF